MSIKFSVRKALAPSETADVDQPHGNRDLDNCDLRSPAINCRKPVESSNAPSRRAQFRKFKAEAMVLQISDIILQPHVPDCRNHPRAV